jgi:hypothetical protein
MRVLKLQAAGIGLFLFIPVVLVLLVRHPEPIAASLVGGVVLMLGHRFVARPYFERVREAKCIWCNRWLAAPDGPGAAAEAERLEVETGGKAVGFVACPGHAEPARRFFAWVDDRRLGLRLGIGVPLVALIAALAAAAFGHREWLAGATAWFRLVIGITVNVASLGPFVPPTRTGVSRAAFPLHNFSLLGVRAILWIFRLVGAWWIVAGGLEILRRAS